MTGNIKCTFVGRAVCRVIAALDACPVRSGFNELDVVLIAQALAARGVTLATSSAGRVVLATLIVGVQPGKVARTDASSHCQASS